jgi:hypothetical protein
MKSRPTVSSGKYGGRKIWMLFPNPDGATPGRTWFLIRHDELFAWWKERRAPDWDGTWHVGHVSADLGEFLKPFALRPAAGQIPLG